MSPTCIPIRPPSIPPSSPSLTTTNNPLPAFLRTPTGLAILELQGTLNIEHPTDSTPSSPNYPSPLDPSSPTTESQTIQTPIGTLSFPPEAFTFAPTPLGADKNKRKKIPVYLFVGKYQKLRGEVRWLDKPLGVLQRRRREESDDEGVVDSRGGFQREDELEIVEIVRWKIVFSGRPEPVS